MTFFSPLFPPFLSKTQSNADTNLNHNIVGIVGIISYNNYNYDITFTYRDY